MQIHLKDTIKEPLAGMRLDQALAKLFPQYSRNQLQNWIENGQVTLDNITITKNKQLVYPGQTVEIIATLVEKDSWQEEDLPLEIIYEDEAILVINKQPGMVVHPGAGNPTATLVNALLHHDKNLKNLPRAGLIHRLDKDTSGLLLVAKTLEAQTNLTQQMQQRKIQRIYHAIVKGHTQVTGKVDQPIGRHPTQRTKMAVLKSGGKEAITHYQLLEKLPAHSYLEVRLETGRTHQIRVHMAFINHPILGDPVYGRPIKNIQLSLTLNAIITSFKRQALHAKEISFTHPTTHQFCTFQISLPLDFQEVLDALRRG